ncbi:MAG: cytidine/deoxycytidylate deaminase family protein [Candidatus Pacebacteria bacterium]|nr:cytidine/deoxycytidylate deaminase family protein [Candidatus Paceibacterota bacterium]
MFIIGVTAPIVLRYKNFGKSQFAMTLETFVELDDGINCGSAGFASNLDRALTYADHIIHNVGSLEAYLATIKTINFADSEAVRPKWDTYFLELAELVSRRSNCLKRAVGAVLVKTLRIMSTGYNGAPFGMKNCNAGGCMQCAKKVEDDTGMEKCICLHAEQNAIFEVGRSKSECSTLYTTTFPCILCTKDIIQAGVARVVYANEREDKLARELLNKALVKVDRISPYVISSYFKLV